MEYKPLVAEVIATFSLVFIGAGAVLVNSANGALGLLGVALAHGLVLMSMIYATGHISGAHVNPAVTIAMFATKQIKAQKAVLYIIAQLLGAGIAGFLLLAAFPSIAMASNVGLTSLATDVGMIQGTLIEAILTFFLVFTIFGVAVDKRASTPLFGLAIGLVLTFDILIGGTFTGAAMNPARWFGPALASGYWAESIVYLAGPIIGALVAALLYTHVLMDKN